MFYTPDPPALDFLKLLAHDVRWHLVAALAAGDKRVQELVALVQRPQNLISYHLRILRDGLLVRERRSSADGRDVYYSLDLTRLRALYLESGANLHPALVAAEPEPSQPGSAEATAEIREERPRPARVLFLCTHNSARSQMAEGILRAAAGDLVEVYSAGNEPSSVHPLAVRAAAEQSVDISGQQSKHLDQFLGQSFDYVITVCDRVREQCPVFPGDPVQIHWSFPDPAAVEGPPNVQLAAFIQTARELSARIGYLRLMIERRLRESTR